MDTMNAWPSASAGSSARRRAALDQWDDTRDEFNGIEQAARFYLLALQNRRDSTYDAKAVKRIDDHASDFAGGVLDLLSDMHGEAQRAADDAGVNPDTLTFDASILQDEYEAWNKRAEARR